MYEPEVNDKTESSDTLPPELVKRLSELKSIVGWRTVLPWGEHCTECAWPTCYSTCELYDPRIDGNCRLFVDGMVRIDVNDETRPYLLKLRFKRWGKLWTVGNLSGCTPAESQEKERKHLALGMLARSFPLPQRLKARVLGKVAYLRRHSAEDAQPSESNPDCFLLECYNPNAQTVQLTLTIRLRQHDPARMFQRVIAVSHGFVREQIPYAEISSGVDIRQPFEVEVVPNEADDTVLYFGLMDFVWLNRERPKSEGAGGKGKPWKCIVWDLDNTLWSGTLIEDGPERIRIREEVVDAIKEADQRGILHSVASKNNYADAIKVLKSIGIEEYFLYPQISWEPKSQAIAKIAQCLNVGIDSLVFVDDQPFEREEVKTAHPQVAVLDAIEIPGLLLRPECQVPVTEESRQRRSMYRQEEERNQIKSSFQGDYTTFLRNCHLELVLSPLSQENMDRVYELAQRTNQMNFSGSRYPREQLDTMRRSQNLDTYVMRCTDRFGSYGIVGFAVVDTTEPRLLDLMFSCRIQSKRVEHEFLGYLLEKYGRTRQQDFFANYRKTNKNVQAGKVFEEIGFEEVHQEEGVLSFKFPSGRTILQEGIVRIVSEEGERRADGR